MIKTDKAGHEYWDESWEKSELPLPFDYNNKSLDNFVNLALHDLFQKDLPIKKGNSVLEIGCANSIWPIYFNEYFDAEVHGLDYSRVGVEKTKELFKKYNIPGKVHYSDLFKPPESLKNRFDLVVSFGVVEHFEDTQACIKACSDFVKPGGYIFTLIPNMTGIIGLIQKAVDRSIFDIHVPLNKKDLEFSHEVKGLKLLECNYFLTANFNVVNSGVFGKRRLNRAFRRILSSVSKLFWILDKNNIKIPNNKLTSPYIIAIAQKNID